MAVQILILIQVELEQAFKMTCSYLCMDPHHASELVKKQAIRGTWQRQSTQAGSALMRIYQALGIDRAPRGIKKLVV